MDNQYHSSEILAASIFTCFVRAAIKENTIAQNISFGSTLIPHKEMRGLTIFLSRSQMCVTKLAGQC